MSKSGSKSFKLGRDARTGEFVPVEKAKRKFGSSREPSN
jgi:hypothetical protein